jgi:hypothetical protein
LDSFAKVNRDEEEVGLAMATAAIPTSSPSLASSPKGYSSPSLASSRLYWE